MIEAKKLKPGVVAYFPEGTPYGPQTLQEDTATLVMQIGGASGNGYLSEARRIAAVDQLTRIGHFEGGRFFPKDDERSTDGFQAAWEFAHGRKMAYPPQRFQKPVFVNSDASGWSAISDQTAVEYRQLWNFGQRTVGVDQYQAVAGKHFDLAGPVSCFVERGGGQVDSRARPGKPTISRDAPVADREFNAFDTVHLATGEYARFKPTSDTRLLVFVHPVF